MKPLDPHVEIIISKFPEYIPIKETDARVFKQDAVLFRQLLPGHCQPIKKNYCYLKLLSDGYVQLSLFKSSWNHFEYIEEDYLETAISFKIGNVSTTEAIIYSLTETVKNQ